MARLKEEMERQQVSGNALSKRVGAPHQRTISDVLNGADPTLTTVHRLAFALGVPVVSLLTQTSGNVYQLPGYPKIGDRDKSHTDHADKKRRRA